MTHNHKPTQAYVFKYRRPSNETIATFYDIFDKGHTISTARDMRLEELKSLAEKEGLNVVMFTRDSSMYPPSRFIQRLWHYVYKEEKYGDQTGIDVPNRLTKMNEDLNQKHPNTILVGEQDDSHLIAIATPLNKRTIAHQQAATKMLFIDSTVYVHHCNCRCFQLVVMCLPVLVPRSPYSPHKPSMARRVLRFL